MKKKEGVTRFGVSLEKSLLKQLDTFCSERGFPNRSQAIRALLREYMVEKERVSAGVIAGVVSIVYDHHQKTMVRDLLSIQHSFHDMIIASQHIHIDHDNCLEVIIVKGRMQNVEKFCDSLRSLKGLKHVAMSITTTGVEVS
ncbi:nickel-responsive transcriptional regulator NikR [Fibrobacterota bacterium]